MVCVFSCGGSQPTYRYGSGRNQSWAKTLATPSDGDKIAHPAFFRATEEKLAIAQRAHNTSRVKALHAKAKESTKGLPTQSIGELADANRLIVVGNVSASKLAKTSMAKSVLDAGWSMLRGFLAYKASRHQATFIEVNEAFTTQTCSRLWGLILRGGGRKVSQDLE